MKESISTFWKAFALWKPKDVFPYFLNPSRGQNHKELHMRIIRLKEVINSTGLPRSSIYKFVAEGTFPKPVPLGGRAVGWVESEVEDWIMTKIEERDEGRGIMNAA